MVLLLPVFGTANGNIQAAGVRNPGGFVSSFRFEVSGFKFRVSSFRFQGLDWESLCSLRPLREKGKQACVANGKVKSENGKLSTPSWLHLSALFARSCDTPAPA